MKLPRLFVELSGSGLVAFGVIEAGEVVQTLGIPRMLLAQGRPGSPAWR